MEQASSQPANRPTSPPIFLEDASSLVIDINRLHFSSLRMTTTMVFAITRTWIHPFEVTEGT
jgi:hypothetical protein